MPEMQETILAALNLSDEEITFLENLKDLNCRIEKFTSPEGMLPSLRGFNGIVVIAVDADVLKNQGHNQIDKLIEFLELEPLLAMNPLIAVSSHKEGIEDLILEKGFAAASVSINENPKTASLKIRNVISVYQSRFKFEMELFAQHEEKSRKEREKLAEIDSVTGIFNRDAFSKYTEQMIRSNPEKKYILVRWDVDRFKVFNDTFGVKEGNILLKAIGDGITKMKMQSVVYGHWSSDHFVMCMEEKLFSGPAWQKYISEELGSFRKDFEFVVRMGVYRIDDVNVDVALMCDRAYLAIKSIKNDYERRIAYFDESMRDALMEEQELINDLDSALKNNEFIIYFQPQYNYATGKMSGAEALVRWMHPEKGFISPGRFIPVFERSGSIRYLDEYIWEHVCMSIRTWMDEGLEIVPVSVNISRRDIYNGGLVDFIVSLTQRYKIAPEYLRLEITESAYMEEPDQLIKVVEKLKSYGFLIEMDDFGSGYSSLNTLKDVPVDILKLDLKFLSSEGENSRSGSILTSIVRMANWLNLPVIAEGVETVDQADFLKSIGCYTLQGYLFSRPIPEDEFLRLMEASDLEAVEENETNEELRNAVDFLNLETQNALLFNSFVGGAAIVEFSKDKLEAIRINDKFFDTIGVTREEYSKIPHGCLGIYERAQENRFRQMLEDAKETNEEASCVLECTSFKPGLPKYWTTNRARYLASACESDIFYVAVENVTEKMDLFHENDQKTKMLQRIMDNVPCGIFTMDEVDGERRVAFVNKAMEDIYGYSVEEFADAFNNNRQAIFDAGEHAKAKMILDATIAEGRQSYALKHRIIRKNGTKGLVYHQGAIIYDRDTIHIIVTVLDLNQQIESDVTKFAQILNKVYDEVFEVNYSTGVMRYLNSNEELEHSSKDSDSFREKLTNWIKKYVIEEDRKTVAVLLDFEQIKEIQATGEVPHFEYSIEVNGERVPMSTTLMQIDQSTFFVCDRRRDK